MNLDYEYVFFKTLLITIVILAIAIITIAYIINH